MYRPWFSATKFPRAPMSEPLPCHTSKAQTGKSASLHISIGNIQLYLSWLFPGQTNLEEAPTTWAEAVSRVDHRIERTHPVRLSAGRTPAGQRGQRVVPFPMRGRKAPHSKEGLWTRILQDLLPSRLRSSLRLASCTWDCSTKRSSRMDGCELHNHPGKTESYQ